jgi:hypothetical protein
METLQLTRDLIINNSLEQTLTQYFSEGYRLPTPEDNRLSCLYVGANQPPNPPGVLYLDTEKDGLVRRYSHSKDYSSPIVAVVELCEEYNYLPLLIKD